MTNFNLPSGAKPIENPNAFAHQSIGNAPAQSPWTAMPSQAQAIPQQQGFNSQPQAVSGLGAPIPMAAASHSLAQPVAPVGMPPMAPMQQPAPVLNNLPPVANAAAAPLQAYEPVEFDAPEVIEHAHATAVSAPLSAVPLASGVLALPNTHEGCWELAEQMAKCDFCPVPVRSPANVFYMLVKAVSFGLPWTEAFTAFYVIPSAKSGARLGMYVRTMESICRKYGCWTVTVDKSTGVATATGKRYSDGATDTVTYDGFDAALRGCLKREADGSIVGLGNWADKWPDMLKARATGRLLSSLFADVLGGVTSVEEMNDMMLEAELRKDAAAIARDESKGEAMDTLKKIRKGRKAKAIDAAPIVEPVEAAAAAEPIAAPAAAPLATEAAVSPYDQMTQGAPAQPAATSLNSLISEVDPAFSETNPLL